MNSKITKFNHHIIRDFINCRDMALSINSDSRVQPVFDNYPDHVRSCMNALRELVFEIAVELDLTQLDETLKWGEPSYLTKHGSTIRMDWKEKSPDQYSLYFKCTSKLVTTFREVYGDLFQYEGNRALVFRLEDSIPVQEVKECIATALRYHKVKALDHLGMK